MIDKTKRIYIANCLQEIVDNIRDGVVDVLEFERNAGLREIPSQPHEAYTYEASGYRKIIISIVDQK